MRGEREVREMDKGRGVDREEMNERMSDTVDWFGTGVFEFLVGEWGV